MKFVPSTYEILIKKHFDESVDESWSNWAIEMMQAGFETESLPMLALLEKPINQFEMKDLTDKVFQELGLNYEDVSQIVKPYVSFLISEALEGNRELYVVLRDLKDLYQELDESWLLNFALLFWAKDDLNHDSVTHYWDANRNNIDQIIETKFKDWIEENAEHQ